MEKNKIYKYIFVKTYLKSKTNLYIKRYCEKFHPLYGLWCVALAYPWECINWPLTQILGLLVKSLLLTKESSHHLALILLMCWFGNACTVRFVITNSYSCKSSLTYLSSPYLKGHSRITVTDMNYVFALQYVIGKLLTLLDEMFPKSHPNSSALYIPKTQGTLWFLFSSNTRLLFIPSLPPA